jgi:hypothetical protein
MRDPHARAPSGRPGAAGALSEAYRVELLREIRLAERGIVHRTPEGERTLSWDEVRFAVAAEVGEPEGVRTIVFDLVLGRDGEGWRVARLDADPGPLAEEIARAIHAGVAPPRRGPSIKSLASDGVPSWRYADLESFEEAVAAAIPPCDP